MNKVIAFAFSLCLLVGCGTPEKGQPQGDVPAPVTAATPAETYASRCASCHQAYAPTSRTAAQWEHDLGRMKDRAGLDEQTSKAVLDWLQANAKK